MEKKDAHEFSLYVDRILKEASQRLEGRPRGIVILGDASAGCVRFLGGPSGAFGEVTLALANADEAFHFMQAAVRAAEVLRCRDATD